MSLTSPARVTKAERQRRALDLRAAGHTFQAIGDELGVTKQRAHQLVVAALAGTLDAIDGEARELRALEAERLDAAAAVLWPRVVDGDLRAHDRWLRNRESYRRLVGLDARNEVPDEQLQVIINMPDWASSMVRGEVIEGEVVELHD